MKQRDEISSETVPMVSVIIPAYNVAKYIAEALRSVSDQTFTSHETIVINDGSPDTDELERELEPYKNRIRYLQQENRGAAAARNTGLRAATGEFVAFLDADDIWLPNFLEEQMALLNRAKADLVYADAVLSGDPTLTGRAFMELQPSHGEVTTEKLLAEEVTVLTSTVLARKEPILRVGLFNEGIKRGHDFDLWFRLAKVGARFAYQTKVLAEHRVIESGLSGNMLSQLNRTVAVLQAIKTQVELTGSENAALELSLNRAFALLSVETGKQKLLCKDFTGALESFTEARRFRWSWKLTLVSLAVKIAPETLWRFYHRRS